MSDENLSRFISDGVRNIEAMLRQWRCVNSHIAIDDQTPTPSRSEAVKAKAKRRDQVCVLTKNGSILADVAHIVPWSLLHPNPSATKTNRRHEFWLAVKAMWGADRVEEWMQECGDAGQNFHALDTVRNVVLLFVGLHRMWPRGIWAIKPLGEPNETDENGVPQIRVQFVWLRTDPEHRMYDLLPANEPPPSVHPPLNPPSWVAPLHSARTHIFCLQSGDIITIKSKAEAPEQPVELPSWSLLDLQWKIAQLMSISGAADPVALERSEDSDDDEIREVTLYDVDEPLPEDWVWELLTKSSSP